MGRPRYDLKDPNLKMGVEEQGYRVNHICIVPVWRVAPLTVDPVFYVAYNPAVIEDKVSPFETDEQQLFVAQGRAHGMKIVSTPNGGFRSTEVAVKMKAEGMTTGFPDVTVVRGIPASMASDWEDAKKKRIMNPTNWDKSIKYLWQQMPVAIEFKRRNGGLNDIEPQQLTELEDLANSGWKTCVAFGSAAAFGYMNHLGFLTPPIK